METEQRIREARDILRGLQQKGTKPHSRTHQDAMDHRVCRLRALEGLCGQCENLKLQFFEVPVREGIKLVEVICLKGNNPLELYRSTPIGEEASCPKFPKANK